MTCEEFLIKWGMLPPVRYSCGEYSIDALYATAHIKLAGNSLNDIISGIDKIYEEQERLSLLSEFGSNQEKEATNE